MSTSIRFSDHPKKDDIYSVWHHFLAQNLLEILRKNLSDYNLNFERNVIGMITR